MEEIKTLAFGAAGLWATWRIGQAVKNKICQRAENRVRRQYEGRSAAHTEIPDLHTEEQGKVGETSKLDTRLKSQETEPDVMDAAMKMASDFQLREGFLKPKLKQERTKIRLEREEHQEQIAALKSQLERTTILAEENETTLLQKLKQERTKIRQEREEHEEEIAALKSQLERTTILAEEKETTLLRKVAEEEAKTAQANAKFAEYKKEQQKYLKERWNSYKDLEEKLHMMNHLIEKDTTFQQKLMEEREEHQEQIAALKSQLERTTILAEEKETTLLRKLSQEEAHRQELVSKWNKQKGEFENIITLLNDENEKLQERLQRTEKSEHSAKVENQELNEKCKEFQEKLHRMTRLMQEKETTFQQKVAEEEAKTAQANAKFAEYKKQLVGFNEEHQKYLKERWNSHKDLEEKLHKMNHLIEEKDTTFQQKLMEEREEHQEQIAALKSLLEKTTILAQENETTLLRKVAEEEAKPAQANAKYFPNIRSSWRGFNREHQKYLKEAAPREAQEKPKQEVFPSEEDYF